MRITKVEEYGKKGYSLYRIPGVVCTEKGTALAYCEARHGTDWGVTDITLRRKEVCSESWSERIMIADSKGRCVMNNPVAFVDGDTVRMIFCRNYRELYYTESHDDGKTWEKARDITFVPEKLLDSYNWTVVAAGPGHGLVTSKGRLIATLWLASNKHDINAHWPSVVTTVYSDDHGKTWECGEIVRGIPDVFVNPSESSLAELSDGSIMMNCRHATGNDMRAVFYSPDGLGCWSDVTFDPTLPDPACMGSLAQCDRGILFTNCSAPSSKGRVHTTVKLSTDDGKSWSFLVEIAEKGGYSDVYYNKVTKEICVFAESGRNNEGDTFSFDLEFTEFTFDEI